MSYRSGFITPPTEQEEIYPYRRVWPSFILENSIFAALTFALFIGSRFITIPERFFPAASLVLALLPLGLWLIFSWRQERFALEPRENLLLVCLISGLTANAVGLPLVNDVLQVERWLSLQSATNRIIGYTFTTGITQSIILYLVIRYIAWPRAFRDRYDSIAYGSACAIGYATVLNLSAVSAAPLAPDIAAIRIFNNTAVLIGVGLLVAYGLSEVHFNTQPFVLLSTAAVAVASAVVGLAIPLRSGLVNAAIVPDFPVSSTSPIRSFAFSVAVLVALAFLVNFLINVAQRRTLEVLTEDET